MKKLIIAQRTNWKNRFYIKFKLDGGSIKLIKKISEELGSSQLIDNTEIKIKKDTWIPIFDVKPNIDIIIGDKFIHLIVFAKPNDKKINSMLDKYCQWAEIRRK